MTKLPNKYIWDDHSKNNFRESLRSQEIQKKLTELMNSDFTNDLNGTNQCVTEFQNILLETSQKV
jgi:hypothetical protein